MKNLVGARGSVARVRNERRLAAVEIVLQCVALLTEFILVAGMEFETQTSTGFFQFFALMPPLDSVIRVIPSVLCLPGCLHLALRLSSNRHSQLSAAYLLWMGVSLPVIWLLFCQLLHMRHLEAFTGWFYAQSVGYILIFGTLSCLTSAKGERLKVQSGS